MGYIRVVPRDLFNESKLLKCLGQFALLVHDGVKNGIETPCSLHIDYDDEPFNIQQNKLEGNLYCSNFKVSINAVTECRTLVLEALHNSKENYPLIVYDPEIEDEEVAVFTDDGCWSQEFLDYVKKVESILQEVENE